MLCLLFSQSAMAESMAVLSIRRSEVLLPLHRSTVRSFSCFSLPKNRTFNRENGGLVLRNRFRNGVVAASIGKEEVELNVSSVEEEESNVSSDEDEEEEEEEEDESTGEALEATEEDLQDISEIKRVLQVLKDKRDMTFGEVKLTIMIEDPRDIERKRLLGIDDPEEITKDDLADALVDVNEGRIPKNRDVLRLLAKEMSEWPDLEAEVIKKKGRSSKSLYAKATDTGVDLLTAAKRLKIDWDAFADIDEEEESDENDVPPAVGYGALYLVTAFPIIIGVTVVLILFYNSLQ